MTHRPGARTDLGHMKRPHELLVPEWLGAEICDPFAQVRQMAIVRRAT